MLDEATEILTAWGIITTSLILVVALGAFVYEEMRRSKRK